MNSLYILIPIAVLFVTVAVGIFFWAVDNGQFDDLEGPAHSILFDEPTVKKNKNKNKESQTKSLSTTSGHEGDKP